MLFDFLNGSSYWNVCTSFLDNSYIFFYSIYFNELKFFPVKMVTRGSIKMRVYQQQTNVQKISLFDR